MKPNAACKKTIIMRKLQSYTTNMQLCYNTENIHTETTRNKTKSNEFPKLRLINDNNKINKFKNGIIKAII